MNFTQTTSPRDMSEVERTLPQPPDPSEFDSIKPYTEALMEHLHQRDKFLKKVLNDLQFHMAEMDRLSSALEEQGAEEAMSRHRKRILEFYANDDDLSHE